MCFPPYLLELNLKESLAHPDWNFPAGPLPPSTVGWVTTFRLPRGKNTVTPVSAVWPGASSVTAPGFISLLAGVKSVGLFARSAFKFSQFVKAKPGNWPPTTVSAWALLYFWVSPEKFPWGSSYPSVKLPCYISPVVFKLCSEEP